MCTLLITQGHMQSEDLIGLQAKDIITSCYNRDIETAQNRSVSDCFCGNTNTIWSSIPVCELSTRQTNRCILSQTRLLALASKLKAIHLLNNLRIDRSASSDYWSKIVFTENPSAYCTI